MSLYIHRRAMSGRDTVCGMPASEVAVSSSGVRAAVTCPHCNAITYPFHSEAERRAIGLAQLRAAAARREATP